MSSFAGESEECQSNGNDMLHADSTPHASPCNGDADQAGSFALEPYENYRESGVEWIGEIPEGWKVVPIKSLFSLSKGLTITKADLVSRGIAVVSYGQVHSKQNTGTTLTPELIRHVDENIALENPAARVIRGDFIFADTSEDILGSGAAAYVDAEYDVWGGYHTILLHSLFASDNRYLAYLFTSEEWRSQVRSNVMGVKLYSISQKKLGSYSVLMPTEETKLAIANYLDAMTSEIDSYVADAERSIDLLAEYRRSVISEAVTKGLDPDAPMRDSGVEWIGEIPRGWEVVPFKRIAWVAANLQDPCCHLNLLQVSPENIEKNTGRLLECTTVAEAGTSSDNHLFRKGQILYSKVRPALNKLTIAPFNGMCSADMYPIETDQQVSWLMYYMLSEAFMAQVSVSANRVKMPKLNKDELGSFRVVLPNNESQAEIANYLNLKTAEIDSLIADKRKLVEKLKEYRSSLISEAVTGKFKVPGVA